MADQSLATTASVARVQGIRGGWSKATLGKYTGTMENLMGIREELQGEF